MSWSDPRQLARLVARFRDRTLTHAEWTHAAHIAVGTWYVHHDGGAGALRRLRDEIPRLNDQHGTPNSDTRGYHETITQAYVRLIAEVLDEHPVDDAPAAVAVVMASSAARPNALLDYYSRDLLTSVPARRRWVPPDLRPLPALGALRPLITDRLVLRGPRPDDAAAVAAGMSRGVSRWLASWPSPLPVRDAEERIAAAMLGISDGEAIHYVVSRRGDRSAIGWVRVERLEPGGARAELGFWLAEPYQGRGYMAEAAAAVCAAAFEALGIETIEAGAQLANESSLRVLQKLGMHRIGERDVYAATRKRRERCAFFELTRPS